MELGLKGVRRAWGPGEDTHVLGLTGLYRGYMEVMLGIYCGETQGSASFARCSSVCISFLPNLRARTTRGKSKTLI